jgi:hypothetical protein
MGIHLVKESVSLAQTQKGLAGNRRPLLVSERLPVGAAWLKQIAVEHFQTASQVPPPLPDVREWHRGASDSTFYRYRLKTYSPTPNGAPSGFIISLLCHDLDYVRRVCRGERQGRYVYDPKGEVVALPDGSTSVDRLRLPPASPGHNSKAEKKESTAAASANFARRTPRHPRTLRSTTAAAMPALSKMDLQRAAA